MTGAPAPVLAAYGAAGAPARSLGAGLINQTLLVERPGGGRFVLQRLHPLFGPEVNEDIDAVTRHLEGARLLTPRLLRTLDGALWVEHAGAIWRALTFVDGISLERIAAADQAREAGAMLARFHRALASFHSELRNRRPFAHDTPRHLAHLRDVLVTHRAHPRAGAIEPLARRILAAGARLPGLPALPQRLVHGDPKLANILFSTDGQRALCLVDLDTLARMPLPLELGDAFRSWCNPRGEDSARASFSLDVFAAAVGGYAGGGAGLLTAEERASLVAGTLRIYVELAARFCADALEESYFGWNPAAYPTRSAHNQARAESQITAAESLVAQFTDAEAVVREAFARPG
jgi:Ser/Thr protein kinase RdoA (MazF antagonist)